MLKKVRIVFDALPEENDGLVPCIGQLRKLDANHIAFARAISRVGEISRQMASLIGVDKRYSEVPLGSTRATNRANCHTSMI